MDSASFLLWKRDPSSTSAAEESMMYMVEDRTRMVTLMRGGLLFSDGGFSGVDDLEERKK